MNFTCELFKYDKIKDKNLPVSSKADFILTTKGFIVKNANEIVLTTVFEPHTIVTFKREDAVVMWLHSESGGLDAYLA